MPALDLDKWRAVSLEQRTEDVRVDAIGSVFGDGECVITVRGLTADEINRAQAASRSAGLAGELAESLSRGNAAGAADKLSAMLGYSTDVQSITAIETEMVNIGIVDPSGLSIQDVVKIGEGFPVEFKMLVEAVNRLTGLGKRVAGSSESGIAASAETA